MMKTLKWIACGLACAVAGVVMVATTGVASAEHISGPCGGASAPSHQVLAHVVGRQAQKTTKVVALVESDNDGRVSGELVVGRGPSQVLVNEWCRIWSGGSSSAEDSGVVHVLGTVTRPDGREAYVQLDIRPNEGGRIRVRTRPVTGHGGHSSSAGESVSEIEEGHGGWVSLTGEGWIPVTRVRIRPVASQK